MTATVKPTIRRVKNITPAEDFAPEATPKEEAYEPRGAQGLDDFSKLDLFALLASTAVAKRVDDPAQIAHESFAIAKQMVRLSELYKK